MLMHIIAICASAAENRMVSSSSSSNTMNTPASVLGAGPLRTRDSWSSFRTAFPSNRKQNNEVETSAETFGELLECGVGRAGSEAWPGARPQAMRLRRQLSLSSGIGPASTAGGADLVKDAPPVGTTLAAVAAAAEQRQDGATMRACFSRAIAHLQVRPARPVHILSISASRMAVVLRETAPLIPQRCACWVCDSPPGSRRCASQQATTSFVISAPHCGGSSTISPAAAAGVA
jgi:hypothetical protein